MADFKISHADPADRLIDGLKWRKNEPKARLVRFFDLEDNEFLVRITCIRIQHWPDFSRRFYGILDDYHENHSGELVPAQKPGEFVRGTWDDPGDDPANILLTVNSTPFLPLVL